MERMYKVVRKWGSENLLLTICVVVQLVLVFCTQKPVIVNMDGIFSYTLANSPYDYLFLDGKYSEFPNDNGWIDAHILKEHYVTEDYDRFEYAAVYSHQRYDVHPPLYYMVVHTFSSLAPGTYSNLYTMLVNLLSLFLADIVLLKLFQRLYSFYGCAIVPLILIISMETMRFLLTWARMYMLLFFFCVWYLLIHVGFVLHEQKKTDYVQMVLCIFLGTLTHYYFYVFAAAVTLFTMADMMRTGRVRELLRYLYFGIMGLTASWIVYPWVWFHIFENSQNKHTDIGGWSVEKVMECATFLRDRLLGEGTWKWAILLFFWCVELFVRKKRKGEADKKERSRLHFRRLLFFSGLLYYVTIYTLDGGVIHYHTALYAAFIVWVSMLLLDTISQIGILLALPCLKLWNHHAVRIGAALVGVWILFSGAGIHRYLGGAERVLNAVWQNEPLVSDFWRAPDFFPNHNCLYVEIESDPFFHNFLFSFGEYRLFKKISVEEFERHGIGEEELSGGGLAGEGLVVYLPKKYELNEDDYRLFAEDGDYRIYEYVGGMFE
ncbi:MAG: hypothetical protein OSJ72_15390 [Lachnospiraceae bacterium]|nr:hypothetical protein [Lachnospiraceae bacterium]